VKEFSKVVVAFRDPSRITVDEHVAEEVGPDDLKGKREGRKRGQLRRKKKFSGASLDPKFHL